MYSGEEDQTGSSLSGRVRRESLPVKNVRDISSKELNSDREKSRNRRQNKEVLQEVTANGRKKSKRGFIILRNILPCPSMIEIEVLNIKWNGLFLFKNVW